MYRQFGKRLFDISVSVFLLVCFAPLIAATAILVRLRLGKPILFRQQRAGKDGQVFEVQKFRSMTDARDARGELLPDEVRLTSAGKFLRASSLDELPQLWNVLLGDMSLIGPRPLLTEYLPRYNSHQARRHEVRPGITGWAQVNGRNTLAWEDRFDHDVYYVDHFNAWLDLKILLLTLVKVFQRSGVNSEHHATMERFMGTPSPDQVSGSYDNDYLNEKPVGSERDANI